MTVKESKETDQVDHDIIVKVDGNQLQWNAPLIRSGIVLCMVSYRALIANMVKGVSEGFKKQLLELVGVGYRMPASHQGQIPRTL